VDIAAKAGTPVCAAADGVVYTTYEDEAMGTTVVIRHEGGYVTMYSSLDAEVLVSAGDPVKLGQTVGYVGNSALLESAIGDHVHFCVTQDDESLDPAEFFAMS
jgi:murein DD-endopeptidase MepM/ murein hydrolase activator NlpD